MTQTEIARPRVRKDPRREATRQALMREGMRLFGLYGVDMVTVRQLADAIGSHNKNVVSYHFGGKDDLVRAILRENLPPLARRRQELMADGLPHGQPGELRMLIATLWTPLFEQRDAEGGRLYAQFIRRFIFDRVRNLSTYFPQDQAESGELLERISAMTAHLPERERQRRQQLMTLHVLNAICLLDRDTDLDDTAQRRLFDDALDTAAAIIETPLTTALPEG